MKFFNIGEIIQDNLGQEFCFVPEGVFPGGEDGTEELEVKAPFYMGRNPVPAALFQAFLKDANYDYPQECLEEMKRVSPMPDCPAVNVSWLDAKEFCRWLRKKTGHYYSLPQSLEWERAARGDDGRLYPWGNDAPESKYAYFDKQDTGTTSQVNLRTAGVSPYGCYDMAGNVWEWCIDSFDDENDPHILRGGSWQNPAEHLDCGVKTISSPPEKRRPYMGFRLLYFPEEKMLKFYKGIHGR